jgi:hypothetical protein
MLRTEDFSLCAAPFTSAAARFSQAVTISAMVERDGSTKDRSISLKVASSSPKTSLMARSLMGDPLIWIADFADRETVCSSFFAPRSGFGFAALLCSNSAHRADLR